MHSSAGERNPNTWTTQQVDPHPYDGNHQNIHPRAPLGCCTYCVCTRPAVQRLAHCRQTAEAAEGLPEGAGPQHSSHPGACLCSQIGGTNGFQCAWMLAAPLCNTGMPIEMLAGTEVQMSTASGAAACLLGRCKVTAGAHFGCIPWKIREGNAAAAYPLSPSLEGFMHREAAMFLAVSRSGLYHMMMQGGFFLLTTYMDTFPLIRLLAKAPKEMKHLSPMPDCGVDACKHEGRCISPPSFALSPLKAADKAWHVGHLCLSWPAHKWDLTRRSGGWGWQRWLGGT
eukprot:scaffold69889_cov20-Tisochrysis_lutea.AAC.3